MPRKPEYDKGVTILGGTGWEGVFKDTPSELSPGGEGPAMSRTERQVLQAERTVAGGVSTAQDRGQGRRWEVRLGRMKRQQGPEHMRAWGLRS